MNFLCAGGSAHDASRRIVPTVLFEHFVDTQGLVRHLDSWEGRVGIMMPQPSLEELLVGVQRCRVYVETATQTA